MLKVEVIGVALLVLAFSTSIPATHAAAQQTERQVRVTAAAGANVRTGAATSEQVLLMVRTGTVLPVISQQGNWLVVALTPELGTSAASGFIHLSTVEIIEVPVRSTPAPSEEIPPSPSPEEGPRETRIVTPVSDTAGARAAGEMAGGSKSVAKPAFMGGALSSAFPGLGFSLLLFMKTGEVSPNYAEQAVLKDKSPEYVGLWTQGYDAALTRRQKKAVIVGAAAGSVIGYFLVLRPLLNALSGDSYSYY